MIRETLIAGMLAATSAAHSASANAGAENSPC
jgi:hypothetical protein